MKNSSYFKFFITSIISGFLLIAPIYSVYAITVTVDTNPEKKESTTTDSGITKEEVKTTATGAWSKITTWGLKTFSGIDLWRSHQAEIWRQMKLEKQAQIADNMQQLDNQRDERVDRVLNEEQQSIVQGSGDEIKGSGQVFLMKLYSFVLSVLAFIFQTTILFYAITVFLIIVIISKIYNIVRGRPSSL